MVLKKIKTIQNYSRNTVKYIKSKQRQILFFYIFKNWNSFKNYKAIDLKIVNYIVKNNIINNIYKIIFKTNIKIKNKLIKKNIIKNINLKKKKKRKKFFIRKRKKNKFFYPIILKNNKQYLFFKFKKLLKKSFKLKTKFLKIWFFLNIYKIKNKNFKKLIEKKNINNLKTEITYFWNFYLKTNFKKLKFKLRFWPKKLRKFFWKIKYKKKIIFNIKNIKKKIKNINFLNQSIINYTFKRNTYKNIKNNIFKSIFNQFWIKKSLFFFFNFNYFFLSLKKKKYINIKKYIFESNLTNLFNKIFNIFNFKIFIKKKINNKKIIFLKFYFFNIYKHYFFKIFNFLKIQFFLSFLYTFWFKDISFLSFMLWNGFVKLKNKEKYVLRNFKSFLRSLILIKYGILGIKIILKGKWKKKGRKKKKLIMLKVL